MWALAASSCSPSIDRNGASFGTGAGESADEGTTGRDGGAAGETTGGGGPSDGGGLALDVLPPSDGSSCSCAAGLDVIYLVSGDDALWAFDPSDLSFELVGPLGCEALTPSSPFSMGISRDGAAWISFWNGDVLKVDVSAPSSCEDPGYEPAVGAWKNFGMAFSSDSPLDACDELYVHTIDTDESVEAPGVGALGRFHPQAGPITPIADIDFSRGELTGTGDGRLFAFAGQAPAKLVEYDKDDGGVVEIRPLPGLDLTSAWAFAFWGGDFWFFTESGEFGSDSTVSRLDYDGNEDGGLQVMVSVAPLRAFGAGVSTCVPLEPQG